MKTTLLTPSLFENFFESNLEDQHNPFITQSSRSIGKNLKLKASLTAAFLWVVAFVLSYSPENYPLTNTILILVYFLAGMPSLIKTIELLSKLKVNISALMTLSAFLSFLIDSKLEGGLLLVLFSTSGSLEQAVLDKAKGALQKLNKISPSRALVLNAQGIPFEKSIKDIPVGSQILVQSGEIIPLDGIVEEGTSSVSLAQITGESEPVKKKPKDAVISGSKNYNGYLLIRTTKAYSNSTITKLIDLITQAQERRPKLQKTFNKYSERYAQSVIFLSFFFSLALPLFGLSFSGHDGSLYRSIAFLIGASPCALILALPISYLTSISTCSRNGILLKGGASLERLSECDTFVFDKTGTLTEGSLCLDKSEIIYGSISQDEALTLTASIERGTTHPIATALVKEAKKRQLTLKKVNDFENLVGKGVKGSLILADETLDVFVGNVQRTIERVEQNYQETLQKKLEQAKEEGYTLVAFHSSKHLALFWLKDRLRPEAEGLLDLLKKRHGMQTLMLTGDHKKSAQKIASQLNFDSFFADLSPEKKLEIVENLSKKQKIAMIGDGINDAPALAMSNCAISLGKIGSQSAIDASHIVLIHEDLNSLDWLLTFSKKTSKVIKQNLFLAASAIIVTSFSALLGIVPLWLAVICHEGSTLLVGLNGLRLLKK
jgi:Zn2+/Cd2+-exporting ATPase